MTAPGAILAMIKSTLRLLAVLLAAGLATPPIHAGGNVLLYPFARLFGSPPEAELAKCRAAFAQLQAARATCTITVAPVLWVDGSQRTWRRDAAEAIVRELRAQSPGDFRFAPGKPEVPAAEFRRNQMRYLWERAAQYSAWRHAVAPTDAYVLCAEVWGHGGKVGAIQVYLLDPTGQIAYCSLANSHQFGPNLPLQLEDPVRVLVRHLIEDLQKKPEQVFPPYGVG